MTQRLLITDQIWRTSILILVFALGTSYFAGFIMLSIILHCQILLSSMLTKPKMSDR